MTLDARAAGIHMTANDLAGESDRLVLHYGEPLAVTGGVMRQTSVTGYTSSGAHRATTRGLDLAVAAHHRNWSHQGGLTNNLVMLGLLLSH